MFKPEKDMTVKEHREMEITKMYRHDEISKLIQRLEEDEIDTFEFRERIVEIMECPVVNILTISKELID